MSATAPAAAPGGLSALARALVLVWLGVMGSIAALVAPLAFELFARAEAGRLMGRIFALEAAVSCAVVVVALVLHRQARARSSPEGSGGGLDAVVIGLALALFCTVAGFYGLQPMMAQARAGQGALGFGALHAVSSAFFAVKAAALAFVAWRLSR